MFEFTDLESGAVLSEEIFTTTDNLGWTSTTLSVLPQLDEELIANYTIRAVEISRAIVADQIEHE